MPLNVEVLAAEALLLSPAERAQLAARLIASLDADPEVEGVWAEEVERRRAAYENKTAPLLAGEETLAKLKAEFR